MSENTNESEQTDQQDDLSADQQTGEPQAQPDGEGDAQTNEGDAQDDSKTFPAAYVRKLRDESAKHRTRAARADELAQALFTERVRALGRLADPADLPYDEALLDDSDALAAAVEALVEKRPHYAARTPRGDVGQGAAGGEDTVDLAAMMRGRA